MKIRVEVKNELLGNRIFWEGESDKIDELESKNIIAHNLAIHVSQDGLPRQEGMWFVTGEW